MDPLALPAPSVRVVSLPRSDSPEQGMAPDAVLVAFIEAKAAQVTCVQCLDEWRAAATRWWRRAP